MFVPRFVILLAFCALLVLNSPASRAAGFNCALATNAVDKTLCSNPTLSALDSTMSAAYARAMRESGSKSSVLQRDQRNWLSERDDLGHTELSGPASPQALSNAISSLERMYSERILFLQHINDRDADSPLLAAIQKTLPKLWATEQKNQATPAVDVIELLSTNKVIIAATPPSGSTQDDSLSQVLTRLPVRPEPHLVAILKQDADQNASRSLVYLFGAGLGGIYTLEGTANCVTWTLFDVSAGKARSVDTPRTLMGNCWNASGTLATFNTMPYAISEIASLNATDIVVQPRQHDAWGAQSRLLVRFDHQLVATDAFCGRANCDEERALAMQYTTRYDRKPLPQTLNNALSAQDASRFEMLRQYAKGNSDLAAMPMFGSKGSPRGTSYTDFVDEATLFPVRFHGELLLGRVGRGHIGWRVGDDWLVGIWRLNGSRFEPVAGAVIARRRGEMLLTAPMPSASIVSNLR